MASLAIAIFFVLFFFLALYVLIRPITRGAIFFPTKSGAIESMIRLANAKPGEKLADLGSGDGRIVIAFARKGVEAHGYEINPLLVLTSKIKIQQAGLQNKAFVHWESFWRIDFSKFDILTVYGMPHFLPELADKIRNEMKPGARVVSNIHRLKTFQPEKNEENVYLYIM